MADRKVVPSPAEMDEARKLAEKHNAGGTTIEVANQLPPRGEVIGQLQRFWVCLKTIAGIVAVILIPKNIVEGYRFYEPNVAWAYERLYEAWVGDEDLGPVAPTPDYYILRKPQSEYPTIIASTTLKENLIPHSGIVSPPWTT